MDSIQRDDRKIIAAELKKAFWIGLKFSPLVLISFWLGYLIGEEKAYHRGRAVGKQTAWEFVVNHPYDSLGSGWACIQAESEFSERVLENISEKNLAVSKRAFGEDVDPGLAVLKAWAELRESAEMERQRASLRSSR